MRLFGRLSGCRSRSGADGGEFPADKIKAADRVDRQLHWAKERLLLHFDKDDSVFAPFAVSDDGRGVFVYRDAFDQVGIHRLQRVLFHLFVVDEYQRLLIDRSGVSSGSLSSGRLGIGLAAPDGQRITYADRFPVDRAGLPCR